LSVLLVPKKHILVVKVAEVFGMDYAVV